LNVLVDINHPAHVHLFKHTIRELRDQGHEVRITARKKDIALELLEAYDLEYTTLSEKRPGFPGLAVEYARRLKGMFQVAREFEPDAYVGLNPAISHVSSVLGGRSVLLHDTEQAELKEKLFSRFTDVVLTPECFEKELGDSQVRYPGYHELAYLHPGRFDPSDDVLEGAGLGADDRFVILRLVSWGASHDIGNSGFGDTIRAVERLEEQGVEVLITSETDLPAGLDPYQISVPPERIHDLMYYADLLIGESPTMATEAAVLGTPAIFVHSTELGYTNELEVKYELVYNYAASDRQKQSLEKAVNILQTDPSTFEARRVEMLEDKVDTTEVILEHVLEACES
jgi:predicted glycosyltransferase